MIKKLNKNLFKTTVNTLMIPSNDRQDIRLETF